jgi:transposase
MMLGMSEYRHGSHSVYAIHLHLVWVTKYRKPVLGGAVGVRVRDLIREICGMSEVLIIKGHVSRDHVHLLVSIPPQVTISRLVQRLKGKTAYKLLLFCFRRKWRNPMPELYYNSAGVSPMRKTRKNYTPVEKVAILKRHLIDRVPVSDLCDEYQLQPTLFYIWQKQFFENGAAALERKNAAPENQHLKTIAALRDKLQRKNEVVAELMEEHIQLKKELGEL